MRWSIGFPLASRIAPGDSARAGLELAAPTCNQPRKTHQRRPLSQRGTLRQKESAAQRGRCGASETQTGNVGVGGLPRLFRVTLLRRFSSVTSHAIPQQWCRRSARALMVKVGNGLSAGGAVAQPCDFSYSGYAAGQ
jgi:hypothetical protein